MQGAGHLPGKSNVSPMQHAACNSLGPAWNAIPRPRLDILPESIARQSPILSNAASEAVGSCSNSQTPGAATGNAPVQEKHLPAGTPTTWGFLRKSNQIMTERFRHDMPNHAPFGPHCELFLLAIQRCASRFGLRRSFLSENSAAARSA